jgi:pimeloyl-ACP methyl ester carboxylesterase
MMRKMLALLVAAALAAAPSAHAQPQPAGPLAIDQSLVRYASTADSVRLPDGRMLHFVCMGKGSPTVILTAGLGNAAFEAWSKVQPAMARITRVCSWDRPGWGLSDGSAAPVTVETTTADLEAALATGSIPGPYVMVGHSAGSYESLLFTDRHPDKVVGMVLVDPSVPGQDALLREAMPSQSATSDPAKSPIALILSKCAEEIRAGTAKAGGPDPDNCFNYPPAWPSALRQALAAKVSNPLQYETMVSFLSSADANSRAAVNPARNYRDMPLVVLSATVQPDPPDSSEMQKAETARFYALFGQKHDELAALSSRGVNARVPGANHFIQLAKPQVVLDTVAEVVSEARAAKRK